MSAEDLCTQRQPGVVWLLEGAASLVSAGTAKTWKLSRGQTPANQALMAFQGLVLLCQEQPLSLIQ